MPINPLQLPGAVNVPQVDFSPLARLPEIYREAQKRREYQDIGQQAQSGQYDPAQIGARLVSLGDLANGIPLLQQGRQRAADSQGAQAVIGALGGGGASPLAALAGGAAPPAAAGPAPVARPTPAPGAAGSPMSRYEGAIAGRESSNRYDAIGPITRTGDRAYGLHQVMGKNVGPWTEQHYGRRLTPQEYLQNRDAQHAVFNGEFGKYVQRYGPEGAARAWFAGERGMNNPNARDVLGTTVSRYSQNFVNDLGGPAAISQAAPQVAQAPPVAAPQSARPTGEGGQQFSPAALGILRQLIENGSEMSAGGRQGLQLALQRLMPADAEIKQMPDGTVIAVNKRDGSVREIYKAKLRPTHGVVREDEFGGKTYGWADPNNLTVTYSEPQNPGQQPSFPTPPQPGQSGTPVVMTGSGVQPAPSAAPGSAPGAPGAGRQPYMITGPGGEQIAIPPGVNPKKFRDEITSATADSKVGKQTEVQAGATQFANRMLHAEKTISQLQDSGTGRGGAWMAATNYALGPAASILQTDAQANLSQAKSQFVTALLRKESGAAIGITEFNRYDREFFPQPGDGPQQILQKQNARRVAIEAMRHSAGPAFREVAAPPTPTSDSIRALRREPNRRAEFDEMYGPGAAKRVLGR